MRPTVRDVAELAAVSPKTVSNVLSGAVPVAEPTRTRVEAAIDELGYVPNLAARGLRSGRTGLVALVMPDLNTAFSAELTHEFVQLAHARGLGLQIEESWGDPVRSRELVVQARRHLVDGVVLNPITREETARVLDDGAGVPLVMLGEVEQHEVDSVFLDSVDAARRMTEHLIALGHRRIALVGGPKPRGGTETELQRRDGYRQALAAAGLPLDPLLERACATWTPRGGAEAMRALLDAVPAPDAVFCCTDQLALGAVHELWRSGLRVPDDVSVAGFDDVADGEYATPALTTVHFDKRAYAEAALDRLQGRIAGSSATPGRLAIPTHVVARASTRRRPSV